MTGFDGVDRRARLAGAVIELVRAGDWESPLASTVTGESGEGLLDVPKLERGREHVLLVRAHGCVLGVVPLSADKEPDAPRRVWLQRGDSFWLEVGRQAGDLVQLSEGTSRVVLGAGEEIARQVHFPWLRDGKQRPIRGARVRPLGGGRAVLDVPKPNSTLWCSVDVTGAGSGRAPLPQAAPFGARLPLISVKLAGEGVLHGRVLDSAGRPAKGAVLDCVRRPHAHPEELFDPAGGREVLGGLAHRGAGSTFVRVRTDARGRFHARGLMPGGYRVVAMVKRWNESHEHLVDLGTFRASADAAPVTLRLDRPTLVVQPHGAAGRRLTIEIFEDGSCVGPPSISPRGTRHTLAVPERLRRFAIESCRDEPVQFELPAGRRFLVVGRLEDGWQTAPAVVDLAHGCAVGIVNLDLAGSEPPGRLIVQVDCVSDASDLREAMQVRRGRYGIFVQELETDVAVRTWELERGKDKGPPEDGFLLAPGRYRLVAAGLVWSRGGLHGGFFGERRLGRDEVIVEIRPGATTVERLTLKEGGYLRLLVRGSLHAGEQTDPARFEPGLVPWARPPEEMAAQRDGATAMLIDDARGIRLPVGRVETEESGGREFVRDSWAHWNLGETARSQALPAGIFTLRITHRLRATIEKEVTIVGGETTELAVSMEP